MSWLREPKGALNKFEIRRDASFRSWLFWIAHNKVANYHRDNGRYPPVSLDHLTPPRSSLEEDPLEFARRWEEGASVRRAVAELPPRQI